MYVFLNYINNINSHESESLSYYVVSFLLSDLISDLINADNI